VQDWDKVRNEIRIGRAAKDRRVQGVIRGPKKRKGVKTLPLSDRCRVWLETHVTPERQLSDPDGPLFLNPESETGWWSETALRRVWNFACKRAGVTPVGVYEGCKHSSATYLKELGADDRLLAAIMSHSDPRSVEKYAKIQGTAIKSALAKLEPK
jgi:site-specific recombinase XerD